MKVKEWLKSKIVIQVGLASLITILAVAALAGATTIGTNISTSGTLDVTGVTTVVNASSTLLTVSGMAYLNGGLTMDTNKFSVADATGNTLIGGTLGVTGLSTLASTAVTNASTTLATFGSGGTTVSGLLWGTCSVGFGGTLDVDTASTTNCTATGVTTSYKVFMTPSNLEPRVVFNSASSTADNTIQVGIYSASSSVSMTPQTWTWMAIK